MRRARLAVTVIVCLGGAGCGSNLPDRMWRSDNLRYFSRAGDDGVCPALLDELEQHGQVIADVLMIERTLVSYYKFDGVSDFDENAGCDPGASACSPNATVRSPVDFDRHELIHAYLSPYGRPPWLLTEGAAVALSCQHYPRPTGDWRDLYNAPHASPQLYGAGGWLVGYLLKMFPARYLAWLYNRLQVNASADQFAAAVKDIYMMDLDAIWPAAIGGPGQPMRCPWECGRSAFAIDGQAHPLAPVCAGGTLQRSVDVQNSGLSRWRIEGAGRFQLGSCDGSDAPMVSVSGAPRPGELLAPLSPGSYFIDAVVDSGGAPALSVAVTPGDGLSWSTCAAAPVLPDDLSTLSTLTLFYPSSTTPQFTSFVGGMDRGGTLLLTSDDPSASASLCASCDPQTCTTTDASGALPAFATPPGAVLSVPAGAAVSASFFWN